MAEFFGELERIAADLYPYRWLIAAGVFAALGAAAAYIYKKGWHLVVWRRRVRVGILGAPVLALVIFVGYDLGSPLFTNKTVEEEFPFAFSAEVPEGMEMGEVEEIMKGMAKIDQMMDEAMPASMMPSGAVGGEVPVSMIEAVELKFGSFRDQDRLHRGSGKATIYLAPDGSHILRLETLDVTNGPDLHVLLSPHGDPEKRDEVKGPGYVDLGKLKGNRGNQNYPIPDEVDVALISSVVVYCKPFHVIFSVAPLEDAG